MKRLSKTSPKLPLVPFLMLHMRRKSISFRQCPKVRHAGAHMKSLSYLGVLAKRPLATQLSLSNVEVLGRLGPHTVKLQQKGAYYCEDPFDVFWCAI